jgi:serine/threonine-protein kinase HipA
MKLKPNEILHVALDFGSAEVKVGRMAQRRHEIFFEYDAAFIASGLRLSPLQLPLGEGAKAAKPQPFEGLFGVFNDSLPDGWGKLLLDRALSAKGVAFQGLTPLDRLAYVGRGGMGALIYYPEKELDSVQDGLLDLNLLADEMANVLEGDASEMLDRLYFMGGSSAGARPKIVAGYNPTAGKIIHGQQAFPAGFEHWLIKFPSSSDQKDIAQVEQAYALMARAAGLEMADTYLFEGDRGRKYFGTKRFDRVGNGRLHMHTASGLLHADHRIPNLDYELLMRLGLHLDNDIRTATMIYRLAVFNVLAHNRDDHSKNFSFLMDSAGKWRFAPAYDLTFSGGPGGEHCTTVLGEGRAPGPKQLLALGEKFGIKQRGEILEQVQHAVARWAEFADEAGVGTTSKVLINKGIQANK